MLLFISTLDIPSLGGDCLCGACARLVTCDEAEAKLAITGVATTAEVQPEIVESLLWRMLFSAGVVLERGRELC